MLLNKPNLTIDRRTINKPYNYLKYMKLYNLVQIISIR